jgi:hypothetical protein
MIFKMICRLLIASMTMMTLTAAQAGMIGADQLAGASSSAQADRAAVLNVLSRPEVVSQLAAQGIDLQLAQERVASMSDSEVQALRGQIGSLPAGAMSHGAIAAIIVVVVALVLWYVWS